MVRRVGETAAPGGSQRLPKDVELNCNSKRRCSFVVSIIFVHLVPLNLCIFEYVKSFLLGVSVKHGAPSGASGSSSDNQDPIHPS